MNITAQEREKYADMWTVDTYRTNSPGERLVLPFLDMATHADPEFHPGHTVLDAGCGEGRGMLALRAAGFQDVQGADIVDVRLAEAQAMPFLCGPLWDPLPAQADWVYCTDVLEHVPEQLTMLVVSRLLDACRRGAFLSICNIPDTYGAWIGKTLHETVRPFVWWRDNLSTLCDVVEGRDLLISSLFLVRPR